MCSKCLLFLPWAQSSAGSIVAFPLALVKGTEWETGKAARQGPADRVTEGSRLCSFFLHLEKSEHLLVDSLFLHRTEMRSTEVKMSGAEVAARTPALGQLFHRTIGDNKGNIQAGDKIIGSHLHCSH